MKEESLVGKISGMDVVGDANDGMIEQRRGDGAWQERWVRARDGGVVLIVGGIRRSRERRRRILQHDRE